MKKRHSFMLSTNHVSSWLVATLLFLFTLTASGQTLRGTVKDAITGEPLPGATVSVVGHKDLKAIAKGDGSFEIKNISIGRYTVESQYLGYEPERIIEVLISSAKEMVINFRLRELPTQLQEVTVSPAVNKARTVNPTTVAGATMISVEEADRFGGNFEDINRVVRHYVGTTGSIDNNGISTHGNPPAMTAYRIEGVEIPSPVHLDEIGGHGTGQISILHTDFLTNGDYYTTAAPAEIGNALGGVMDMRFRNGNASTYEHSAKISMVGVNATSEGPISKKNGSSYLVSYRYGMTKLANDIGLSINEGDQAGYHDVQFKLNFPLSSQSTFSVWGVGGWSGTSFNFDDTDEEWTCLYQQQEDKADIKTMMGGLTLDLGLGQGWRLKGNLAATHRDFSFGVRYAIFADDGITRLTEQNRKTATFGPVNPFALMDNKTLWLTASADVQKRFSSHYLLKFGSSIRHIDYEQTYQEAENIFTGLLLPVNSADKQMQQVDAYATNNLRFGQWTFNAGLHLSGWTLSSDWTLQPRFSTEWRLADGHAISFGYGMSTRTESYDTYFAKLSNQDLKPIRSHQLVLDYKWQPSLAFCIKAEGWAEWQSAVPVSSTSTYCSLNRHLGYQTFPTLELVSEGRARNYGVSLSAEHYMTTGFYWLLNGSVYKSEYRGSDQIWRPTLFDRGWTANVVGGKEWKIKNKHLLAANIAFTAMGGRRHTPFDEARSALLYDAGSPFVAYDETRTMEERTDPVIDLSLNITYRIHGKKVDQVIGLDYMNILANEEPYKDFFDYNTRKPKIVNSYLSIPNLSYAIIF